MKTSDSMERHVTPADGNIFEDLGFPPGEAKTLIIRSTLMVTAKQVIEERELTQTEAAKLMGVLLNFNVRALAAGGFKRILLER